VALSLMVIRILPGQDGVYAIVVTASMRRKFELNASAAELRSKAFEALQSIADRSPGFSIPASAGASQRQGFRAALPVRS